jgi:hypothetical protein
MWCAAGYTYSQQITKEASKGKALRMLDKIVPEHYWDFSKVFSKEESNRLPTHKAYNHVIDLKPNAPKSLHSKVYPMPVNEQAELDWFLKENLKKGYIVPSKSPMSSPVFFIKKKDRKLCLIQDYWKLNDISIKNRYPLPLASDIINHCAALATSQSLMYTGATRMYGSRKGMNGKLHLQPTAACSNLQLCSSG